MFSLVRKNVSVPKGLQESLMEYENEPASCVSHWSFNAPLKLYRNRKRSPVVLPAINGLPADPMMLLKIVKPAGDGPRRVNADDVSLSSKAPLAFRIDIDNKNLKLE